MASMSEVLRREVEGGKRKKAAKIANDNGREIIYSPKTKTYSQEEFMKPKKRTLLGEGRNETSILGDDSKVGNFVRGAKQEIEFRGRKAGAAVKKMFNPGKQIESLKKGIGKAASFGAALPSMKKLKK